MALSYRTEVADHPTSPLRLLDRVPFQSFPHPPPHFTENLHTALAVSAAPSTNCEDQQDLNATPFTALHSRKPSTAPAIPSLIFSFPFPQSCIPRLTVLTPASEPRRICPLPLIQPPPLISTHQIPHYGSNSPGRPKLQYPALRSLVPPRTLFFHCQ
jgi:hypothetical protein